MSGGFMMTWIFKGAAGEVSLGRIVNGGGVRFFTCTVHDDDSATVYVDGDEHNEEGV